jgi:toxin ParE1/3/4
LPYRLTAAAEQDIADILRETARMFGPVQRARYADLVGRAADLVAAEPERPGSLRRADLGPGIRSFHVELAARRRGAASHILYYLRAQLEDDTEGIVIARVLHKSMEPGRHLIELP